MLFKQWEELKLIEHRNKGEKVLYYPAIAKSEVLQFHLAQLATLYWDSAKNDPQNVQLRKELTRKIAVLNNIYLAESSDAGN